MLLSSCFGTLFLKSVYTFKYCESVGVFYRQNNFVGCDASFQGLTKAPYRLETIKLNRIQVF